MNTAEPKNHDQIEAKRDPKLLETESVQSIISDIINIGNHIAIMARLADYFARQKLNPPSRS
jgi:hypothetical protein